MLCIPKGPLINEPWNEASFPGDIRYFCGKEVTFYLHSSDNSLIRSDCRDAMIEPVGTSKSALTPGIGLALSGGGFRATLFHVGSLWRINQLGLLPEIKEITSVSGGSIAAAYLGLKWKQLNFDANTVAVNFESIIVKPLCDFCANTIDRGAIVKGILNPFSHPSELLAKAYGTLFENFTLQDLPEDSQGPRFTIYATSMQTGASVRLSRPYIADYHVGQYMDPKVRLSLAVAASSGFPPPFCPVKVNLDSTKWKRAEGADLYDKKVLRKTLRLVDGGVYDNLGLERLWERYESVFVSDAGAPFDVNPTLRLARISQLARTKRTLDIMGAQTRALRVRRLIADFKNEVRRGAYWGINTKIDNYELGEKGYPLAITHDSKTTADLSQVRTRLNKFKPDEQGRLINWGYALTDAALRCYWFPGDISAGQFPISAYPV